jgi:hypothetical protein
MRQYLKKQAGDGGTCLVVPSTLGDRGSRMVVQGWPGKLCNTLLEK